MGSLRGNKTRCSLPPVRIRGSIKIRVSISHGDTHIAHRSVFWSTTFYVYMVPMYTTPLFTVLFLSYLGVVFSTIVSRYTSRLPRPVPSWFSSHSFFDDGIIFKPCRLSTWVLHRPSCHSRVSCFPYNAFRNYISINTLS